MLNEKMPLYEYRCDSCGDFEAWRSISEYNAPITCSGCDRIATKIFSVPNINLNSGSLSKITAKTNEPRLVQTKRREPNKPKYQSSTGGRPWMFFH